MTLDGHDLDFTEHDVTDVSDDELTALALAADPDAPVADDAVNLWELAGAGSMPLLPQWYMPAPAGGGRQLHDWRRWVVPAVIAAFVVINAYGLCSTYGQVTFG
jgi:hypothetical protein